MSSLDHTSGHRIHSVLKCRKPIFVEICPILRGCRDASSFGVLRTHRRAAITSTSCHRSVCEECVLACSDTQFVFEDCLSNESMQ